MNLVRNFVCTDGVCPRPAPTENQPSDEPGPYQCVPVLLRGTSGLRQESPTGTVQGMMGARHSDLLIVHSIHPFIPFESC